jgi:hypothetical protein
MTPTRIPRKLIPCVRCGRRVLVAAYGGTYPTVVRCAACRAHLPPLVPLPDAWRSAA